MNLNIFQNNIDLIRRYRKDLLADALTVLSEDLSVRVEFAKNGQPFPQLLHENWLNVHSKYNPQNEANTNPINQNLIFDGVTIIFGAGFLYHVLELVRNLPPKAKVIVIEPNYSVLCHAIMYVDLGEILLSEQVEFLVSSNKKQIKTFLLGSLDKNNFISTRLYSPSAYQVKYLDVYNKVMEVKDELFEKFIVEHKTVRGQTGAWVKNSIENFKNLGDCIKFGAFEGAFINKPAVIVGAGPSLDKNVELLKDAKDKFLIIAFYKSVATLEKHGIKPDIVVAVDARQLWSVTNIHEVTLNYPLLYITTTDYRLVDACQCEKIFALTKQDKAIKEVLRLCNRLENEIYASGTVALTALDFAAACGCDPIVLVGQDLAYTNNKRHTAGANTIQLSDEDLSFFTKDIYGEPVPTSPSLNLYRTLIEQYIEFDQNNSSRVYIDATEGGAKIKGTRIENLCDCVSRYNEDSQVATTFKQILVPQNKLFYGDESFSKETFIGGIQSIHDATMMLSEMKENAYEQLKNVHELFPYFYEAAWADFYFEYADKYNKFELDESRDGYENYRKKHEVLVALIAENTEKYLMDIKK